MKFQAPAPFWKAYAQLPTRVKEQARQALEEINNSGRVEEGPQVDGLVLLQRGEERLKSPLQISVGVEPQDGVVVGILQQSRMMKYYCLSLYVMVYYQVYLPMPG
jgi:hypothetical protein